MTNAKDKNRTAIYPGTFDPITNGHCDILSRARRLFGKLIIGVAGARSKNPIFSLEERVGMLRTYLAEYLPKEGIEVFPFEGLLVDFAEKVGADVIIRGLRAVSDFEYEFQMYCANSTLKPSVDTLFLPASEKHQFLSSRFVKEIAGLGGDVSSFTPLFVEKKLREYYSRMPRTCPGK